MPWTAHIDGGSRGNPGPAAAGIAIRDPHAKLVFAGGFFLGRATNNQAEYRGLLAALDLLGKAGAEAITVLTDSELLARQIGGQYRVKSPELQPLFQEARERLKQFEQWEVRHVPRAANAEADRLANQAMDHRRDVIVRDTLGLVPSASTRSRAGSSAGPVTRGAHSAAVQPAEPQERAIEVVVTHGPRKGATHAGRDTGCPGGTRRGQSFRFTSITPADMCVDACAAVIEAVLAWQNLTNPPPDAQPVHAECPRCAARFEIRPQQD